MTTVTACVSDVHKYDDCHGFCQQAGAGHAAMTKKREGERGPLGDLIFRRRKQLSDSRDRDYTRTEAAAAIGADQSTISNWENGKRRQVDAKYLKPLAEWLGIDLDQLVSVVVAAQVTRGQKPGPSIRKRRHADEDRGPA